MRPGTQPELESERLRLRPYVLGDANAIQLLAGDIRIAKETMNICHPYEDGMAEKWILLLNDKWSKAERAEFAIVLKETSEYLGSMSFISVHGDEAEIGYRIGFPYWNNGYCTEAGRLLVAFGFTVMGLSKITARHLSSNPKSGKVLEKLGLVWKESKYRDDRTGNNVKLELYETPAIQVVAMPLFENNHKAYHAHVYFEDATKDSAKRLCDKIGKQFDLKVGKFHENPIGPHPRGSCQISFGTKDFQNFIPWLDKNRKGLTIFVHGITGDDLKDHTDFAYWLGQEEGLNLSMFYNDQEDVGR